MKFDYRNPAADKAYERLAGDLGLLPFRFTYGGKKYKGFSFKDFHVKERSKERIGEKEVQTIVLELSMLEITIVLTHYYSHGVTEWTVWFSNSSEVDSEILEDLYVEVEMPGKYPVLDGILGDHVNMYRPYSHDLVGQRVEFSSDIGRATHINFPYFDLAHGDGGTMLAIGWAGTWSASFQSDGEKTTYIARSVNGLHTYLKKGEKIRTALFVFAPYAQRSRHYSTNFWRDWFIRYNLPRADRAGNAMTPFSTCCLAHDTGLPNSDGSISERYDTWKPSLEKMIEEDVKVDFRWFDAGWYIRPDLTSAQSHVEGRDWWESVGTWELDPQKWPGKTFLESTEFARENGMRTLVWFEPERVTDPENLAKNFGYNLDWAIRVEGENAICNNIGDPACLEWTTERICKMLRENKVEMYREDNNCNAAVLWKYLDAKEGDGRQGITECKMIAAHYEMWDRIIACTLSYGGCGFVDSCASGGGRNDLESMRRGFPLLRSDVDRTSTALRLSMTWGFNRWLPFCGANTKEKVSEHALTGQSDPYVWRASYLAALNVDSQFVQDPDQNFNVLRFGLREWKQVSPYLLKNFYPLTPWHSEQDKFGFTAFCYYDTETEKGVLLAFRQECCLLDNLGVILPFADKDSKYKLTDADTGTEEVVTQNLSLRFPHPRCARLLWIERL